MINRLYHKRPVFSSMNRSVQVDIISPVDTVENPSKVARNPSNDPCRPILNFRRAIPNKSAHIPHNTVNTISKTSHHELYGNLCCDFRNDIRSSRGG
jgi:hypothetical protein